MRGIRRCLLDTQRQLLRRVRLRPDEPSIFVAKLQCIGVQSLRSPLHDAGKVPVGRLKSLSNTLLSIQSSRHPALVYVG